jgi:hypothetical protein
MRNLILFLLIVTFAPQAMAKCSCIIAPIHIYGDGSALMFAKRYETGDCAPGRCRYPTNVYDPRIKGAWEHYPETCPTNCRVFGVRSAAPAKETDGGCGGEGEPGEGGGEPNESGIEGLPVNDDFEPVKERRIPQESVSRLIGFYTLGTANKVATNVDSDTCVKVGNDIEVKIFSVRIPKVDEEQLIAYEVKQRNESARRIESDSITNVRFEPIVGDRALSLQVNDQ